MDFSWDRLISPIGAADFERDVFSRKPLHLKARDFPDSGLETLDGWRSMLRGQSTRLQGRRFVVDLDSSIDGEQPLCPDLEALLDQGGPLIVNAVDRINPVVRAMADAIAVGVGARVVVNGYISPNRRDALDLHADDHEVVVLQRHGVKRWTIGTKIAKGLAHSSLFAIDNASISEQARRSDTFRGLELHPREMLYLPRGLAHQATARDDLSIHLSVGVFRPIGLDFAEFVLRRLIGETASQDYFPNLRLDEGGRDSRAYMDIMTARFEAVCRSEDLRTEFLEQCRKNARLEPDEG